ncbi:YDG domain-containing protein [Selenomonas ruminis]|uniref:Filamentous hemagglutinin N-terminal domain-containing protein n=1 Tax=Selenomonas ruminis TaxID=2593411 RepID=A0A5D6VXW6_9FIRM|nr:YDG domain-containing protein [Selenomonas sp. mPRGC5]TYZ20327.1 filamentous hemagglutinin N-terminal domain-containing protein [Selenomonas sp. mPRGC5]
MDTIDKKAKLTAQISITLMAGMFSMVPVTYGAPVLDEGQTNTAKVTYDHNTTNVVDLDPNNNVVHNNVVHWQDFSVAKNETVSFDGGEKKNNYLNIVTGTNQSQIDGAIQGGNNVYIVNQHGVIFGKDASVDVGNLYVSTTVTNKLDVDSFKKEIPGANPLQGTAASAAADVVNMGKVQADSVYIEGNNIRFMNTDDIKTQAGVVNTNVTLNANGNIRLDHKQDSTTHENYTINSGNRTNQDYILISSADDLKNINEDLSGRYALANNIDLEGQAFTPIGGNDNADFTGKFDGNFFVIDGLFVKSKAYNYGGLFGKTNGAAIENVGLRGARVYGNKAAGGLIGQADNTTIKNVYSEKTSFGIGTASVTGITFSGLGGIIGVATSGTTIKNAYNETQLFYNNDTLAVTGGIVGSTEGNVTINDAYSLYTAEKPLSTGVTKGQDAGIVGTASTSTSITNAYTTHNSIVNTGTIANTNVYRLELEDNSYKIAEGGSGTETDATKAASYGFLGSSDRTDDWVIYNGRTLPMLRSFLKANGTVNVNYGYTRGTKTDKHTSSGDEQWEYNAQNAVIDSYIDADTLKLKAGDKDKLRNAGTYNLYYTDQNGYDLTGNTVTITPKTLSFGIDAGAKIEKTYDGKADASDGVKNLFSDISGGIFAEDAANGMTLEFSSDETNKPKFVDDDGKDSPDVGTGKHVHVEGSIKLTGNEAGNYVLVDESGVNQASTDASGNMSLTISGDSENGVIKQREILVELKKKSGINRDYNGKTIVTGDGNTPAEQVAFVTEQGENRGKVGEDDITLVYETDETKPDYANYGTKNADGSFTASKMAGDHDVRYGGIKLTGGTKTKNYKLVDATNTNNVLYSESVDGLTDTGINVDDGGALYGTGTINRLDIAKAGYSWYKKNKEGKLEKQAAEREYTAGTSYTGANGAVVRLDEMPADDLTFTVTGADFVTASDGTSQTKTKDAADNLGVRYVVTVSGDDAVNYKLDGVNLSNGLINQHVYGAGKITPRTINLKFSGEKASKAYDGDEHVKVNDAKEFGLDAGYVVYDKNDDTDHHLIQDDTDKIVITGEYLDTAGEGAKNVNIQDKQVADKNITYTAKVLKGDGTESKNYVIAVGDTTASTATYNGTGLIRQREITAIDFYNPSKDYDESALVQGKQENDKIALAGATGVVTGEDLSDIFSLADIKAKYGSGTTDATFQADANVMNYGATNSKDVQYTGVAGIIKNSNYVLAGIGDTVYDKGTIKPLTIADRSKLDLTKLHDITKVYDGNENVETVNHDSQYYVGTLTYDNGTSRVGLDYTINKAYYNNKSSNDGTSQGVTYELTLAGSSNYKLSDDLLDVDTNNLKWTQADDADMVGTITPKNITVAVKPDNVTKVYDGSKKVYDAAGNEIKDDAAVEFTGWIDGTRNVAVEYEDKNVNSDKPKNVYYKISMDTDSQGNYRLKDTANKDVVNNTLTGTGDITPAALTITYGPVSKTYDGNAEYTGTVTPVYEGIKTDAETNKVDDVSIDPAKYAAVFNSPDVKTADTVTYVTVLQGKDKGNYIINPANSQTVNGVTKINGAGKITPKDLTDNDVDVKFADKITKVYDTTNSISYDHTDTSRYFGDEVGIKDQADYIQSITIGGVTLKAGKDYKINSAIYNSAGIDANSATYQFGLLGDALSNFNLSGLSSSIYANGVLTQSKNSGVSITPKAIRTIFADKTVMEKVYDGRDNLPSGVDTSGKIKLEGVINANGDTTALDTTKLNGRYVDKNVAYDAEGNITTKDVLYDVVLKGNGASNYVIEGTNANTATITGKDLGRITPRELTADFDYTERSYNNKTGAEVKGITLDGLQNNESITLDKNDVTGTFGNKNQAGEFIADGNVNYQENAEGKAGFKGVQYSGLQNALAKATGTIHGNYTIADTVYFAEAAKKGRIKRLALTMDDIDINHWKGDITKVYDGSSTVLDPEKYFSVHTYANDRTGGEEVEFKLRHDKDWANYVDATGNKQVNVVQGDTLSYDNVVYKITGLDADDVGHNFDITGLTSTSFSGTYTTKGSITPRVLKIKTDNLSGYTKTYDGEKTVKDAAGNIINNFAYTFEDDHGIVDKDKNTVNLTVTGAYADKNANVVDPDSKVKSGKQIDYTLKLTGNTAGNYTLDSSNTLKGAATEEDKDTYKGDGEIKRRVVYADFADGYGRDIKKEYNGDDAADADKKQRNHINLLDGTDENTGIVADEKNNITLLADSISAAYAGKDVARDAKGNVTTKDVYFSNFQLDGATKDNYVVKAKGGSDTLTGSGTITPRTVNVSVKEGPVKEYDRDTSLADKYLDKANINVDNTNVIGGDTVGVFIQSGSYKDWNADTGKDYTYQLGWTNGNYALKDTTAGESLTTDGMTAELTGHNGTIEKRLLTVTDVTRADKTYDGTDGVLNAAGNIVLDDRIIKGDNIGLKASGTYDNGNAAAGEDTDALLDHDVSYTLSLDNTNYQLDKTSAAGKGTIRRKGLDIVAEPQKINVGETIPPFTGSVLGLEEKDSNLVDAFTFAPKDEKEISNSIPGKYGVYGWYKGKTAGNVGQNYIFSQNPANEEAFIVNLVDPGREYHDTVNPKSQFRPDQTAYQQSSLDDVSAFGGMAKAALEYRDTKGTVLGITTISSGDVHELEDGGNISEGLDGDLNEIRSMDNRERLAKIGITGSDVVNMENVDAGSVANIQVDSQGEIVNLEIVPLSGETSNRDADAEIQSAV